MNTKTRISVIIPNFNRETLIGETLSNLLAQTRPPDEIIVIDDGSTDQSVRVIQSFGDQITLIQQENQGPGAARNAGLKIATGDFVQFQDSDDLYSLNKLEAQAKTLEETGADIVFCPWIQTTIDQRRLRPDGEVLQQQLPPGRISLCCWCLRGWATVFQGLMFRRSFLDGIGRYRTDLMPSEDSEYFFRMLLREPKIAFTNDCLLIYRLHSINKITKDEGMARARRTVDWSRYLQLIISHIESTRLPMDVVSRWCFYHGVRKNLETLNGLPGDHGDLAEFLSKRIGASGPWLDIFSLWIRLATFVRLRLLGRRWMAAYQSSRLTPKQFQLIADLGFEIA